MLFETLALLGFLALGLTVRRDPTKLNFLGAILGGIGSIFGGGAAAASVAGAAIGAGASLIGGAADRKATAKANAANRPVEQVKQWEEAGINPAFGISSGGYIPQRAASMGDSFATAGGIFADYLQNEATAMRKESETKKENKELREKLDEIARPRTAGHLARYGAVLPLPSVARSGSSDVKDPVTIKSGDIKKDGEADRLDIDKGGNVKDSSIYDIDTVFGTFHTSRPMYGERMEGYAGDIGAAPMVVPQIFDDAWNNVRGRYFDANQQKWNNKGKYKLAPKGEKGRKLSRVKPKKKKVPLMQSPEHLRRIEELKLRSQ